MMATADSMFLASSAGVVEYRLSVTALEGDVEVEALGVVHANCLGAFIGASANRGDVEVADITDEVLDKALHARAVLCIAMR